MVRLTGGWSRPEETGRLCEEMCVEAARLLPAYPDRPARAAVLWTELSADPPEAVGGVPALSATRAAGLPSRSRSGKNRR
ncbi:hypothetical protein GCM10007147_31800 [Nocardiopsis kunsanensis]|uniref:Uncharacterized protein n=1 Tax=Nocardiopsis kunsanensis TaxID=141693 RepID=A0A918XFY3_9ACTN|nr:hypothetical protein GCM10007147_31800 [Nocardiopsis kunsanensis]